MDPHLTPTALLMDRLLRDEVGEGLIDAVLRLRDAGESTRSVALWLHRSTGWRVTHESVRMWEQEWRDQLGEPEPAA